MSSQEETEQMQWYKKSYGVFNKLYVKNQKKNDKKKEGLIKRKFKSLFE